MKIIFLTDSQRPYYEINIKFSLWLKLLGIFFIIFSIDYFLFDDETMSTSNQGEFLTSNERINRGIDGGFHELQLRLEIVSSKLDTLTHPQLNKDSLLPKVIELSNEQKQQNPIGGPLFLSNKTIDDEGNQVLLDNILRQINDIEYQVIQADKTLKRIHQENQLVPSGLPIQDQFNISSPYGYRVDPFTKAISLHEGIDLATTRNTNIYATADGFVSEAGNQEGYGLMIEIQHPNGFITRYGHANQLLVSKGQVIKKGDLIGLVGSSGRSTGTHLHYEVLYSGQSIDPLKLEGID
jgi:murein DD-endopeptidase MepM/ murein hydrolase activator NlpD